jgi:hypothetical protein
MMGGEARHRMLRYVLLRGSAASYVVASTSGQLDRVVNIPSGDWVQNRD